MGWNQTLPLDSSFSFGLSYALLYNKEAFGCNEQWVRVRTWDPIENYVPRSKFY